MGFPIGGVMGPDELANELQRCLTKDDLKLAGKYILNLLIVIDEFGNALAAGGPHESISSRLGRNYKGTFLEKLVDMGAEIIAHEKDHCEQAAKKETGHSAAGLDEILAEVEEEMKQA